MQAWIYEHFEVLRPGPPHDVSRGELITMKWKGISQVGAKNSYRNMRYLRGELDALTKDDVR